LSGDEYAAPLLSFWQRGVGRAAAVSFPMAGAHSETIRAWPEYGDFVQTLGRWLMGDPQPPGLGLRSELAGATLKVDLLYDDTWEETMSRVGPQLYLMQEGADEPRSEAWQRMEPGRYQASMQLAPGQMLRGAVHVGTAVLPFGPLTVGVSPEWAFDRERQLELAQVSRLSGGEERLDLSEIWTAPRRSAYRDIRDWLAIFFLGTFLAEALVARMGWSLPTVAWRPKRPRVAMPRRRKMKKVEAHELPPPVPVEPEPPLPGDETEAEAAQRRSRYARAKRRR
jgi:hypothetical protein